MKEEDIKILTDLVERNKAIEEEFLNSPATQRDIQDIWKALKLLARTMKLDD